MYKKGKMIGAIMMIGFLILVLPAFVTAKDKTINVRCDKGESVQEELDKLKGPATIVVTGTCHENIVIKEDDVTLEGGTYEAFYPTRDTILVQGARRVAINSVTVRGGKSGVVAFQGGSLTLGNSLIEGATLKGVVADYGSTATVNNCTIRDNTQVGVFVTDNSALFLTNSTITSNGWGVSVQRSSNARIGQGIGGVLGPNQITNNGGPGVAVLQSAYAEIDGNTITGNSGNGVQIDGASANVINNTVANSRKGIVVQNSGGARIGINWVGNQPGPNTIENNSLEGIQISNGGAAYIFGNTIQGNGLTTYRPGVGIYWASAELIGNNTIRRNGGHGVQVSQGRLFESVGDFIINPPPGPDLITENGYSGISAWNTASLDIQNATITNNTQNGIILGLRSTLRIYNSTVSGHLDPLYHGIAVYDGSAAAFYHPTGTQAAIITGNSGWGVFCNSNESSYTGDISGVTGNGSGTVSCSGF